MPQFAIVARKLEEARQRLEKMGSVLVPPEHRSGFSGHIAAQMSCPGTIVGHIWQPEFDSEFNAFLSTAKSVPDIILHRFGHDTYGENQVWLSGLDQGEQSRRKNFDKQFRQKMGQFHSHPLTAERNATIHHSGVANWKVSVKGWYGTYTGDALNLLPSCELRPMEPNAPPEHAFAASQSCPLPVVPNRNDFFLEITASNGSQSRRPLFRECQTYLSMADGLLADARALFKAIHEGHTFTLPPR